MKSNREKPATALLEKGKSPLGDQIQKNIRKLKQKRTSHNKRGKKDELLFHISFSWFTSKQAKRAGIGGCTIREQNHVRYSGICLPAQCHTNPTLYVYTHLEQETGKVKKGSKSGRLRRRTHLGGAIFERLALVVVRTANLHYGLDVGRYLTSRIR